MDNGNASEASGEIIEMDRFQKLVMVVDDDPDIRSLVTGLVQLCDGDVLEHDGSGAVEELAAEAAPDLVILDVMMPEGDGFKILEALRKDARTAHIPVIMLSAVNDYELGRAHNAESIGLSQGVRAPEAFVEKPMDTKIFLELIREHLSS